MFKAGALAVIGDSGRFSRQVPSFSGGVFGDSGRFAGSIFWNRPSFADHHTRPEDRVFLSFPKAPPFARWGLGAELTWPAPKKRIPLGPLQTDFLESQRITGIVLFLYLFVSLRCLTKGARVIQLASGYPFFA